MVLEVRQLVVCKAGLVIYVLEWEAWCSNMRWCLDRKFSGNENGVQRLE